MSEPKPLDLKRLLERGVIETTDFEYAPLLSIAISLKRLADISEAKNARFLDDGK